MGSEPPDHVKALMSAAYDATAASFAAHADRVTYRHLSHPLADAVRAAVGAAPVLDVASGPGALSRLLDDVVATDLAFAQLTANRARYRVCADADALPFARDAFAAVACAFGVNHFPAPERAIGEMARVAPFVGLLTWARPDTPYRPKEAVSAVIERHAGVSRTPAGTLVDDMTDRVGSPAFLRELLVGAGLRAEARHVRVDVPWTGPEDYVSYRLGMFGAADRFADAGAVYADAVAAVRALPVDALPWRPTLVLAIGRR